MYYVYYESMITGRMDFICQFNTAEEAIKHIGKCYSKDREMGLLGKYYYFMEKRQNTV